MLKWGSILCNLQKRKSLVFEFWSIIRRDFERATMMCNKIYVLCRWMHWYLEWVMSVHIGRKHRLMLNTDYFQLEYQDDSCRIHYINKLYKSCWYLLKYLANDILPIKIWILGQWINLCELFLKEIRMIVINILRKFRSLKYICYSGINNLINKLYYRFLRFRQVKTIFNHVFWNPPVAMKI